MASILENLDYTIEILEDEKKLFLDNRDLLERESTKLEALRPIYMKFNELYRRFRDNVDKIKVANHSLKDNMQMKEQGDLSPDDFLIKNDQLKTKIQNSYTNIEDDIFPKLRKLAIQISLSSVTEEKKGELEKERDAQIKKIEDEIKERGEMINPYLKILFPLLIKKVAIEKSGQISSEKEIIECKKKLNKKDKILEENFIKYARLEIKMNEAIAGLNEIIAESVDEETKNKLLELKGELKRNL
ncbi:MAG: hypothetical protein O8C68_01770 [Candidatus Methanoperedens sp.]|nr:hypothetical protein [Candidatus Methanoperedens sp.]